MKTNMRTFYTLILTQVFSIIGSQISGLAVGMWVFSETSNATPLALVAFFNMLPLVLASSVAGVLADRWNRRYVMALADLGQAAGTVLLLVSVTSGSFQLWHLYAVTLIQGVFGVFQSPAFAASMTMLVADEQRDRTNAIQQIMSPAAGIIAPAIAGLVYATVGVPGAILIDMLTFLVAVAVVLRVHIPQPEQTAEGKALSGSFLKEALSGVRFLWSRRPLLYLILHISLLNFLISGAGVLLTPYLLARTGSSATTGLLLSIMNLGAIVGGVVMGIWGGTRPRIHTAMVGVLLGCGFMILAGMGQTPPVLGITMFLFMTMPPIINSAFMSMLQAKVPPDIQGRVFSVVSQFAMLISPIAYLLVGPLADTVFEPAVSQPGWERFAPLVGNQFGAGMGLILVMAGAASLLATLAVYALPMIRSLEATLPDYEAVAKSEEPVGAAEGATA